MTVLNTFRNRRHRSPCHAGTSGSSSDKALWHWPLTFPCSFDLFVLTQKPFLLFLLLMVQFFPPIFSHRESKIRTLTLPPSLPSPPPHQVLIIFLGNMKTKQNVSSLFFTFSFYWSYGYKCLLMDVNDGKHFCKLFVHSF